MRDCLKKGSICLGLLVLARFAAAAELPPDVERFASPPPEADEVLLQLIDTLGNPPRYCLDIPGFGMIRSGFEGWKMDWPIETHTCKTELPKAHYFFVDQLISRSGLQKSNGQIRFTRFDKCAEIMQVGRESAVREDSWVLLAPCNDNPRQQFMLNASGEIRPALDSKKCLTVGTEAHEAGNKASNEPWYQRAITLSTCSEAEGNRQKWRLAVPPAARS
ncbi:MAG TPA: ricin-type beta-trefoil lectin domain protein [Steroidobacter sp.]|uniref:ricin-type beta-trefoil lectin domain protein n=1 Tax=Steroidobacter sp. TaxID=1978227 RepID=UPI002EDA4870